MDVWNIRFYFGVLKEIYQGGYNMEAIGILIGLGICVFLLWFFDAVIRDSSADDGSECRYTQRHYDLRNDLHKDDPAVCGRMH